MRRRSKAPVHLPRQMHPQDKVLTNLSLACRDFLLKQSWPNYRTLAAALHQAERANLDAHLAARYHK